MAKKNVPATGAASQPVPAPQNLALPVLALTLFIAPALGSPVEEMLQDTLKSAVVSFGVLLAAMALFFSRRQSSEPLRWHALVALPLLLCAYALGSMAWSHTYLGGVEAVRWFVFTLLVWLGLNTLERERIPMLAWAIHLGGVVASLWAVLQFWFEFALFPQGPNPGSTFVNRNFFAEFAVCTLPFAAWLLARAKGSLAITAISASAGLTVTAILMTGTRGALLAMWLLLLLVLPLLAWRFRAQFAFPQWGVKLRMIALATLVGTVLVLGLFPSGNKKILEEERGGTGLARGIGRTQSIGPSDHSLGIRMLMWKATLRVIEARPLTGVGAGAWENEVSRYQEAGSQLETDYYVHNEYLQLVAEYGLVGWLFLLLLAAYLLQAAWRTWQLRGAQEEEEGNLRALAFAGLFTLMVVSSIGFPWRLAVTGTLFALCLGMLAASDARLGFAGWLSVKPLRWQGDDAYVAMGVVFAGLATAVVITHRAAEAERNLVRAARLALTVSASNDVQNPKWDESKLKMLQLTRDGVRANAHYRKLTPIIADELARWNDWGNAVVVWESVLASRPYVVAIIANVGRGYSVLGDLAKANHYLERARALQPRAPAVRSLEVILLAKAARERDAYELAKKSIDEGIVDYDLATAGYTLAIRANDVPLAQRAIEARMKIAPQTTAWGHMQLGELYFDILKDSVKALAHYKLAMQLASPAERQGFPADIPITLREQAVAAAQTSASSK